MSKKWKYRIGIALCLAYVCIIEPTDFFPPIGWLDEATVLGIAGYLYKKLKALPAEESSEEVVK